MFVDFYTLSSGEGLLTGTSCMGRDNSWRVLEDASKADMLLQNHQLFHLDYCRDVLPVIGLRYFSFSSCISPPCALSLWIGPVPALE